jgi:hypothetical protein
VSDVAPPPAESRDSAGAIVLHHAPVRAQREGDADPAAATRTMGNVGRGADQPSKVQGTRDDLTQTQDDDARELRLRGASSLIAR